MFKMVRIFGMNNFVFFITFADYHNLVSVLS